MSDKITPPVIEAALISHPDRPFSRKLAINIKPGAIVREIDFTAIHRQDDRQEAIMAAVLEVAKTVHAEIIVSAAKAANERGWPLNYSSPTAMLEEKLAETRKVLAETEKRALIAETQRDELRRVVRTAGDGRAPGDLPRLSAFDERWENLRKAQTPGTVGDAR
jgi:hypothetical protein